MSRRRFNFQQPAPKPAPVALATVLRESTTDAHKKAEHHPMQQALVRGLVSQEQFVRVINEMRHVQLAARRAVDYLAGVERTKALAGHIVDRDEVFVRDMAHFGAMPNGATLTEATRSLETWIGERIAAADLKALVGLVYVTEGITNSGYYIARAVERNLHLPPGVGTAWLNPYGEDVRTHWEGARVLFNELAFSADEAEAAVGGARHAFAAFQSVFDGLMGDSRAGS